MGMSFLIIAENEKHVCDGDYFPDGLTWFFERVGKYGNDSKFIQVQTLFNINLDIFNTEKYKYDNEGYPIHNWIEIDSVVKTIDTLIERINSNPDYSKKIIYDTLYNSKEEWRLKFDCFLEMMNKKQLEKEQGLITKEELSNFFMNNMPPESGLPLKNDYLKNGEFIADLIELKRVLKCYKKNGVNKISLIYV